MERVQRRQDKSHVGWCDKRLFYGAVKLHGGGYDVFAVVAVRGCERGDEQLGGRHLERKVAQHGLTAVGSEMESQAADVDARLLFERQFADGEFKSVVGELRQGGV